MTCRHSDWGGNELCRMGDSEPIFEVDDGVEWAIGEIGGWTYLLSSLDVEFEGSDPVRRSVPK
jgi:hypothetical protein